MPGSRIPALLSKSWTRSLSTEFISNPEGASHSEAVISHSGGDEFSAVSSHNGGDGSSAAEQTGSQASEVTHTEEIPSSRNEGKGLRLAVQKAKKRRPLSKNQRIREEFRAQRKRSMSPHLPCFSQRSQLISTFFLFLLSRI